jgi:SAM-dependent methyltransferase
MCELAEGRGIRTYLGCAEDLPFPDSSFDGILMALTLSFVADPQKALRECSRVLRPDGRLLLGVIPRDSPWGRAYERRKVEGHPVFACARFLTSSQILTSMESAGFDLRNSASTLFWEPGSSPERKPLIQCGIAREAGFVGLLFTKKPEKGFGSENGDNTP